MAGEPELDARQGCFAKVAASRQRSHHDGMTHFTWKSAVAAATAATLLAASGGCMRDSDRNVTVREPPQYVLQEEWRFVSNDSSPVTQITRAEFAVSLPNGRLVVPDMSQSVLRLFDADSGVIKMAGRKGEGPGEFDTPMSIGVVGDTIWVFDWTIAGEYELFDFDLRHIGVVGAWEGGGYGVMSGGRGVSNTRSFARTGRAALDIIDETGQVYRTIVVDTTMRAVQHKFPRAGGRDSITSPVTAHWSADILPGGHEMVVLAPGDLFVGAPGEITLRRARLSDGLVSAPIVFRVPVRVIDAAERTRLLDSLTSRMEPANRADYIDAVQLPDVYPGFRTMRMGRDSTLWLSGFPGDTTHLVVSLAGELLARVHVSAQLRLLDVGMKRVWGRLLDEDGVPIIVSFSVVRER
jgi:hypothetical protein